MSGRSGHVRQFPTSKAQIAYSARFLNYPGKAKRESCKKKAHNDGHVPHKRKRNYPAQKVVQQMVEQVGTGGCWWVLLGTGGYWRVQSDTGG